MVNRFETRREIFFEGKQISLPLYMDYQASTPLDTRVETAMAPWLGASVGNPHSKTHVFGHRARHAIETARRNIAALINAQPNEIIFTSGGTEANNLALMGYARARKGPRHIISVATEHDAIRQPLYHLARAEGVDVTFLDVDSRGLINLNRLIDAFRDDTILVSIMAANNETGVKQDIEAIGRICEWQNVAFHSDAVQALASESIDVETTNLTMMSLSAHKIYGPMGIGALYIREGTHINPLMYGGSQQRAIRSGTLPTALCVGFGEACRILSESRRTEARRLTLLRHTLIEQLRAGLGDAVRINGDGAPSIPGCLSITFDGVDAEELLHELPDLALSTGSACHSEEATPSHVLLAMGRSANNTASTVRLGLGRPTGLTEVNYAAAQLVDVCRRLALPQKERKRE
ncbi:cysteine desulfurase family protein [Sneathiella sp.]|uniref:cysteine desulfurase family protein n=1 Tax=Sneathiella sp. TaxID=1964365 RepID=UPI0025F14407|nr:cysteine desulfurase family protein [Sneathiella sp.]